jgi:hypothetical protein
MATEPNRVTETTDAPADEQRRCHCGRELREPGAGSETPTCIGCDQPEAACACGPND